MIFLHSLCVCSDKILRSNNKNLLPPCKPIFSSLSNTSTMTKINVLVKPGPEMGFYSHKFGW